MKINLSSKYLLRKMGILFFFLMGFALLADKQVVNSKKYVSLLGVGLDVDWMKTGQGMKYYDTQTVKDFKKIGLSHVRIRMKDKLSKDKLELLDKIVQDCLDNKLIPILAYQGNQFKTNPNEKTLNEVVEWWKVISERYKGYDPLLSFDIIIEVTDKLNKDPEILNQLYARAVKEIRKTNPSRFIFLSPRLRSSPENLKELKIPVGHNDSVLAEWHFYAAGPSKKNENKLWTTGTEKEKDLIREKIQYAMDWQKETGLFSWVGAWMPGNYNDGNDYDVSEQVIFAGFVSCELKKNKIPHAVNSDTKFYDRKQKKWNEKMKPVLEAILNPKQCK
ncbi:MAG: cellulase family glycosylhydrolase [Leptospiraceae bacterium]|nr:cellulase family glycosylhydrolase [Leptospiraceae bacterium]